MRPARIIFIALLVFTCARDPSEAQTRQHSISEVRTVTIDPQWNETHDQHETSITIRRVGEGFRRNNSLTLSTDSSDEVRPAAIQSLLSALQEPFLSSPNLANLGITHEWLMSHADQELQQTGSLGETNGERQQEFFRQSFTDVELVKELLPGIIAERWTDDGAWVHVSVAFADGSIWAAETTELPPFMLPWTFTVNGQSTKTYNADISVAIAALLPEGAPNRNRLLGVGIERLIGSAVELRIKAKWQEMGAEDRAGAALKELRKRYVVRRSEVSSHQGLGFEDSRIGEDSLQADVRLNTFPENLVVATAFPIHNGEVEGLNSFLQLGNKYERLVLTNPWIMKSLRGHADVGAWLYFETSSSLSDKALRTFDADMKEIGKGKLIDQVKEHREDVALLNYNGNQLILFPDHHAIIWRWGPYRDLFSWKASTLKTERCTNYNTSTEGCVGAIVSSDGSLLK